MEEDETLEKALPFDQPIVIAAERLAPIAPGAHAAQDQAWTLWTLWRGSISRRVLLTLLGTGGGVAAATMLFAGCSFGEAGGITGSAPAASGTATVTSTTPGGLLAHTSDLPINSAKTFPLANQQNPGVLIHLANQQFVAFDTTCTHLQCEVGYDSTSGLLTCPCHGSEFDPAKNASVVQGPAQTPLRSIPITIHADGSIVQS